MGKFSSQVLVVDVESTAWEPKDSQPKDQISEIIEIGITNVDIKQMQVISNESILVRPQRSKLSQFCTQLTTLTQDVVDQGILFQEACQKLKDDYKSYNKTMVSWGDYDRLMFQRNCIDYNCDFPFGKRHLNLKNLFTILYGLNKEPGMEAALNILNIPLKGIHHRGSDDSLNIAKILIYILSKYRLEGNK